jgi:hypothetical protein
MTTPVDLSLIREILGDALKAIETLDGTAAIADATLSNKPDAARLNRTLLNLADQLQLAASLVRNVYWHGKGQLSYDL